MRVGKILERNPDRATRHTAQAQQRRTSRSVSADWQVSSLLDEGSNIHVISAQSGESVDVQTMLQQWLHNDSHVLLLLLPCFGDFDSFELATWVQQRQTEMAQNNIRVVAIGVGTCENAAFFARSTGLDINCTFADSNASAHDASQMYNGVFKQGGLLGLLLMCAGIGSPGTLAEVFRGYAGDANAEQIFKSGDSVGFDTDLLPEFDGGLFDSVGTSSLRPMELATRRLQNMVFILKHWEQLVHDATFLPQRGGAFALRKGDGRIVFQHRDPGLLGYVNLDDAINALINS